LHTYRCTCPTVRGKQNILKFEHKATQITANTITMGTLWPAPLAGPWKCCTMLNLFAVYVLVASRVVVVGWWAAEATKRTSKPIKRFFRNSKLTIYASMNCKCLEKGQLKWSRPLTASGPYCRQPFAI